MSSAILATLVVRGARPARPSLRTTARAIVEFAGLWAGCLILNLALGVVAILGVRFIAGTFASIYILNDVSVVILAALQAVGVLVWLRGAGQRSEPTKPQPRRPSGAA
jgi:hypothetical protein